MLDLIIKNGQCYIDGELKNLDVAIKDGKIQQIGKNLEKAKEEISAKDQIILPHPSMHKRNFVLFPLFEINKTWKHPINKQDIKILISELPYRDIRSIKQI